MQLLFKHSFGLIRFVKCFARKPRKRKKAARRKKVDPDHTQSYQILTALLNLTVTIPFGTPVPKASKMHFSGTSQPWMPKMFQGTLTEIERRFRCWYKKFSWVKFLISCKPEVSHTSLVLRTYMNVPNIPEHSRIITYDKTYA